MNTFDDFAQLWKDLKEAYTGKIGPFVNRSGKTIGAGEPVYMQTQMTTTVAEIQNTNPVAAQVRDIHHKLRLAFIASEIVGPRPAEINLVRIRMIRSECRNASGIIKASLKTSEHELEKLIEAQLPRAQEWSQATQIYFDAHLEMNNDVHLMFLIDDTVLTVAQQEIKRLGGSLSGWTVP